MMDFRQTHQPTSFENVVEQNPIKEVLKRHIEMNKPSPLYIFSGIRGCGKHTVAKIFTSMLNRTSCSPKILQGDKLTTDDIRELLASPIDINYNVYVIDKGHLLSTEVATLLLEHFKNKHSKYIFIVITTKPSELGEELGNKVARLTFSRLREEKIIKVLEDICKKEALTNYEGVCTYIAFNCRGSLGEALTLLQSCAEYSTELNVENIKKCIKTYSYEELFLLMTWVVEGLDDKITAFVDEVYDDNRSLEQLIDQLLRFAIDINIYLVCKDFRATPFPAEFEGMLIHLTTMRNPVVYYAFLNEELIKLKFWVQGIEDIRFYVNSRLVKLSKVSK